MESLDFHDLLFFGMTDAIQFSHETVGQFLKLIFAALAVIFRNHLLGLKVLDVLHHIAADVAHGNPRFFETVMDFLDQVPTAILGERRQVQANDQPVIIGGQTQFRGQDRFLDGLEGGLVEGFDHQCAWFGHADGSQLH